ncbi:mucin-2-like [Lucilia sericata]|uniref:mucin-2-like n=1 Tax=Lucilia sericata TaxID=13632 RepID=UPI0018A843CC|nr:mucin-2-like [Lucilia sericata]
MLIIHKILKTIIILLAVVKLGVTSLVGTCNQCFASNNIACLDETHFATCFQGSPTSTITKCPANRFCTDDVLICHSSTEGFSPICHHDNCNDCEATNGIFSCLDETTYGYCFGANTPLKGSLRSCPKGYVCNYNFREVCVPEETHEPSCAINTPSTTPTTTITTEISIIPSESTTDDSTTLITTDSTTEMTTESTTNDQTTSTTEMTTDSTTMTTTQETESTTETTTELSTTSTTPKPPTTIKPRDPNTICGEIGKTGYFRSDDPTCREYVYCYLLSGQYLGWVYYCDGYFNAATQKCQKTRPLDCIAY